jgi:hypothetical protein
VAGSPPYQPQEAPAISRDSRTRPITPRSAREPRGVLHGPGIRPTIAQTVRKGIREPAATRAVWAVPVLRRRRSRPAGPRRPAGHRRSRRVRPAAAQPAAGRPPGCEEPRDARPLSTGLWPAGR